MSRVLRFYNSVPGELPSLSNQPIAYTFELLDQIRGYNQRRERKYLPCQISIAMSAWSDRKNIIFSVLFIFCTKDLGTDRGRGKYSVVAEDRDSESNSQNFNSGSTIGSLARYSTFLYLSFFICKMGVIIIHTSQMYYEYYLR